MEFAEWLIDQKNEGFFGDLTGSGRKPGEPYRPGTFINELPHSLFNVEKEFRDKRKANLAVAPDAPVKQVSDKQIEEVKGWLKQLQSIAEKGREQASAIQTQLLNPEASVLKRVQGEEKGDPLNLLMGRFFGHIGMGLEKVLYGIFVKILHVPAMVKFFTKDVFKIFHDLGRSAKITWDHPTNSKSWKALGYNFLNVARLPIAMLMMGVGAKLTYQQYQLIHSLGFTNVDLVSLGTANAALCWFLFICFLMPHWFLEAEAGTMKTIADKLQHLFPAQMYSDLKAKQRKRLEPRQEDVNTDMDDLKFLCEDISRYSIEVNYRTPKKEVLDAWAKLVLGFVSSGLQREGYHVKHVYSEKPLRILVSTNNWDDGAWTALLCWNCQHEYFVISSGFWNKDRRTVSLQRDATKCAEDTASALVSKMLNFMHDLKKKDPRKVNTLRPARSKRGPKK